MSERKPYHTASDLAAAIIDDVRMHGHGSAPIVITDDDIIDAITKQGDGTLSRGGCFYVTAVEWTGDEYRLRVR